MQIPGPYPRHSDLAGLRLRPDRSIQTKKRRILVRSMGVLSKAHTVLGGGRPWEVRETVYHKGCWESRIRNLHLLMTLWAII